MNVINKLRNRSGVGLIKDVSLDPHEAHDILAHFDHRAAALALAREALEAVKWMRVDAWYFCPWCKRGHLVSSSDDSHSADCQRQIALEAMSGPQE